MSRPRRGPASSRRLVSAAALALVLMLAGCASSPGISGSSGDGGGGYVSADGTVAEFAPADRGEPIDFAGTTERDEPVSSEDYAGRVLVVNFWYAACGPCIVEAPLLEEVWQEFQPQDVGFLGVNIYDQADTAISFATENGVTYPSVIDVNAGAVKLAFAAATPIQATPTTLVLDREGRIAARIIGQLESTAVLSALIETVLAEAP